MVVSNHSRHRLKLFVLVIFIIIFFFIDIGLGSVYIPMKAIISIFLDNSIVPDNLRFIILHYRIPKALTSILVGGGLSVSGLLIQTLFRNPLAGPFVLGISSGAGLGVALLYMGSGLFGVALSGFSSSVIASSVGCFLVLLIILTISRKLKNTISILIIGVMINSFVGAAISILSYFSNSETLQQFVFWSMGNTSNLSYMDIFFLSIFILFGIGGAFIISKSLNAMLLGENYAKSMGVDYVRLKFYIILITTLLAGVITALSGPIAFVGLAVPHLARQIYRTLEHKILIIASFLLGALVLLICDIISQVPFQDFGLPINAVTSLFGAPLVIWILLKQKSLFF